MDQPEPPPQTDFSVEKELHHDVLGRSYLARRAAAQTPVRVLLLAPRWGNGEAQADRLRRLMQVLAEVKSPALLRWLTCKPLADEQLQVVTEWAGGERFATWLQTATEPQLLEALRQIAALLASAHAVGVAHGLLNREQITVSDTVYGAPQVHVHDLGLLAALLHQPTSADFAPHAQEYLAPEQRRPAAPLFADGAADVYALGVLARKALAQVRARSGASELAPLLAAARAEEEFLSQLVREIPGERPAMAAVASVLQRWAGHAAAPALKSTQPNPTLPSLAGSDGATDKTRPYGQSGAAASRLPHTKIGNFRFIRELGAGGMGTVYEAVHEQIERRVAIKIMNPKFARNPEFKERFLREARAANMVSHRSLVQITDFGSTEDGALYLVMEFLSGESLARRLEENPDGIPLPKALHIASDLARALAVLHAARIVHRDLKPENLMMVPVPAGESEQVKILDFGIAKLMQRPEADAPDLTEVGRTMGSPDFMAPEQFLNAGAVDAKADVFSLALIICVMVSGKRPFSGFSWVMLNPDRVVPVEVPAALPPHLRQLVTRMLAVDPAQRPAMTEVAQALQPRALTRLPFFAGAAALLALGAVIADQNLHRKGEPPPKVPAHLAQQAESILRDGCRGPEPLVRKAAAKAVAHAGQAELASLLIPMLQDRVEEVRTAAGLALAKLAPPAALTELRHLAELTPVGEVQVEAAAALLRLGDPQGESRLRSSLGKPNDPLYFLSALRLCAAKDTQGCTALKGRLDRKLDGIPELEALYTLALSGDSSAAPLIQKRMESAATRTIQLGAAQRLARLRGPQASSARTMLEQAAPRDLTAAVFVAELQSDAGVELLARWVSDAQNSPGSRVMAAEALGDSGFIQRGLAALTPFMASRQAGDALQLSAASSILLLVNPSRQEDLDALSALTGRSSLLAWVGDLPEDKAEATAGDTAKTVASSFAQLGSDERRLVAIELRRRTIAHSIDVLQESLVDSDPAVQIEGARSIKHVIAVLMSHNTAFGRDALQQKLARLSSSSHLVDQVIATSIRAQLGEPAAAAKVRALYAKSSEEPIRDLIVNLAQPATDQELLVSALNDRSALVRFSAARRLAEVGDRRGQQVLFTDGLNSGGSRALVAYSLLVSLGVEVQNRSEVLDWPVLLNRESDLWVRYEGIVALASLRPREAIPLLRQSLSDPAAVVRRTIAYVSHQLYNKEALPELKEIVHKLLSDPELIVRIHAARLYQEMNASAKSDLPTPTDLRAPDLTPVAPATDLATPPPDLGSHPLATPHSPSVAVDPKWKEAAALEERAKQAESKSNYIEALESWDKLARMERSARIADLQTRARAAMQRLIPQVSRYRVHVVVDGVCVPEAKISYERPGNFTIKRNDRIKTVQLLPGRITEVKLCP